MLSRAKIIFNIVFLSIAFLTAVSPAFANNVVVTDCTATGLQTAWSSAILNGGGTVTFNCGTATIPISATLNVDPQTTSLNITVDGGGLITLDGLNTRQVFFQRTWGNNGSTLTLQNLTITGGRASGSMTAANGGAVESVFGAAINSIRPVLNVDNVTFSNNVSNLTSAASGDFGGAAIYSQGGTVNVTDSTFSSNTATGGSGAAIHILQSGLSIASTTFVNNITTNQGGSIYVDGLGGPSGAFSIVDSSFTGSRSYNSGGAIYVNMYENTTSLTINRTSFIDNGVNGGTRGEGGAIAGGSTTAGAGTGNAIITITNSLFANNFVDRPGTADGSGGAINFNQRAQVTIANTTFDGNQATGGSFGANGGALVIINNTTQFQIINSTITNNFAGWGGGGIMGGNGILRNTIVAYNSANNGGNGWNIIQQCTAALTDGGNNLQFPPRNPNPNNFNEVTCFAGKTAINQMGLPDYQDPLLDPLTNNGGPTLTRSPQANSPAIDYGNDTICAGAIINNLDQRGMPRPIDGNGLGGAQCDTGAFEYVSNQPPLAFNLTSPTDGGAVIGLTTALMWAPAPFATQYHLLVDNDSNFSSPLVDTTTSQLTFTPSFLGVGLFYWNVEASNINGNVTSSTHSFTLNSAPEAAPIRNYYTIATPTLMWNDITWATHYQIQISQDANFSSPLEATVNAGVLFYVTPPLNNGIFYWRVRARNSAGVWGTWSAADSFMVDTS